MALFKRKKDGGGDQAAVDREVDVALRVLVQYPPETTLSFGAPVRCPVCANFGLVESVDRAIGHCHNRCLTCGHEWVITARGLRLAHDMVRRGVELQPAAPVTDFDTAPVLSGSGVMFQRDEAGEVDRHIIAPAVTLGAASSWAVPARQPQPLPRVPMRVLLVEDNPSDLAVVKAILEPAGPDVVDLRWAPTRAAGEAAARSDEPDLVLLDLGLPDSHGFQTVTQWHFSDVEAPVLVVSGEYGADVVDRGRELGVTGFMDKAELADLLAAGDEGTTMFLDRLETAAAV